MAKFRGKYRIESTRLENWDYSTAGFYFCTINTQNNICCFGEVENEKIKLNSLGEIVKQCWEEIPLHYKSIELDYFIIMPNHVHGIIQLKDLPVETSYMASLQNKSLPILGDIIGKFKAGATRKARKSGFENFAWQKRFYDRIIRSEQELFNIRNYIEENPLRWEIKKEI